MIFRSGFDHSEKVRREKGEVRKFKIFKKKIGFGWEVFFGTADDSGRAFGRPNVRPDASRHARPNVPQTLTKNRFTNLNHRSHRYSTP